MESKTLSGIAIGVGIVIVLSIVFSLILSPIDARDNPLIIQSGSGSSSGGDFKLLAQNTTITGTTTTIIMNQILGSNSDLAIAASAGNLKAGEALKTNSILAGQTINSISAGIKKVGVPVGTLSACVMNSAGTCLYTFGTMAISSLTTSYVQYTFTNTLSSYTLSVGEYVGFSSDTLPSGANQVLLSSTTPNQFDGTNSVISQFSAGTWTDANTWDVGSSGTNGAFILRNIGMTSIQADFTAKKYLFITVLTRINASNTINIRLNDDALTNYASRTTINGVDSNQVSRGACEPLGTTNIPSGDRTLLTFWIDNNLSSDRKIITGYHGYGADTNSATAPNKADFVCKWSNTSNQVNEIDIIGALTTDSKITVWGYD